MEEQHKSKIVWVLFIIIVALVGLNIYQYYLANNLEVDTEVAVVETSATPTATASVSVTPTVTGDITANWKTYTNTKYGYSIKYPDIDNWNPVIVGMIYTAATPESDSVFITKPEGGYAEHVFIIGISNSETRSLEDLATLSKKSCNSATSITNSNVTINGISGIKLTFSPNEDGCATDIVNNKFSGGLGGKNSVLYLLKSGNNFAEIALINRTDTEMQNLNDILDTFQFTQ